jgi:hypothetical protein
MHHIDQAQLVAGMLRSFMWAVGAAVAFGQRRVLLVIGLGLATVTSVVFALSNAGAPVSMTLFHVTSYASTVTPSFGSCVLDHDHAQPSPRANVAALRTGG